MPNTPVAPPVLPDGAALYMLLGEIKADGANHTASLARIERDMQAGFLKQDEATKKVQEEVEAVNKRVDAIDIELADRDAYKVRFEDTERSAALAHSRIDTIETTGRVAGKIAGWLWAVGGAGIVAVVWAVVKAIATGAL